MGAWWCRRDRRPGHAGEIGPKPIGGMTSVLEGGSPLTGCKFGKRTRPQVSCGAVGPVGTPTGLAVSGPPAARSQVRGIVTKGAGSGGAPSVQSVLSP